VWTSTQSALFVQQAPVVISADSTFSVFVVPDSITTVSTTAGATHGAFPDSPVPAPLPWDLPFRDDFDEATYAFDAMARFFADQAGSWAVRNGSLTQVSWGQPIAWAPNGDPLSIVGSEDWIDYAVSATAVFSPKAPDLPRRPQRAGKPRSRRGYGSASKNIGSGSSSAAVYAVACDASDGAQVFAYNASSGWFGSAWGGSAGCITTCGCDTTCIQMWGCGVPGCGVPFGGASYNWTLSADGALSNFAYPGLALEADAATGSVALLPATGAPSQRWTFDAASGAVRSATSLCLSQLKPSLTYAQVCGRMGGYDGFNPATTPAYCTAVFASGAWALLVNSRSVRAGNVSAAFNSSAPHKIGVSMAGNVIESYLDGQLLASIMCVLRMS